MSIATTNLDAGADSPRLARAELLAAVQTINNLTGSTGDAYVGTTQAGVGAVPRSQQAKNRDIQSTVDFGADSSGATESAALIAAALATGKLTFQPKGTYRISGVNVVYATDHLLGVVRVGNRTETNSSDPQVIVARAVDDSGSGNAHCFSDSSTVSRSGGVSYNSYDARASITLSSPGAGHYAGFQDGPTIASTGTLGNVYSFVSSAAVSAGTLSNLVAVQVNAPTITGAGAVTTAYGLKISQSFDPAYTAGLTAAWGIYQDSAARSWCRGIWQCGASIVAGNRQDLSYSPALTIDAITNAGTQVGIRLSQNGVQTWDISNPASQTYLALTNAAGEVMRLDAAKNVITHPPATVPTLANGELVINMTSDTNCRISFKGSDGVVRAVNLTLA